MKCFCFLLLAVGANCFFDDFRSNGPKIVGGEFIDISDVPYQAQILDKEDTLCGAAIISEHWLISAAHCFGGDTQGLTITTGSSTSFSGQKHEIEKIITHPDHQWSNVHHNDIALIKVKEPIEFNTNQRPVPLSTKPPRPGYTLKVSGYGWESLRKKRQFSIRRLKVVNVKVFNQEVCARRYREIFTTVTGHSFCAGYGATDGAGSCSRDSGGPGVINGKLAGVVSGGYECNTAYYPGIYTRVHLYRDWIATQTGLTI